MNPCEVIIVGAGITGVVAARHLELRGYRCVLLDKSRGLGGRMATRRSEQGVFDHGVQYFEAISPQFQKTVNAWMRLGIARPWTTKILNSQGEACVDGGQRFCGTDGMNSIPRYLSQGLNIRVRSTVTAVRPSPEGWDVVLESGESVGGRALLLTPPVPQSLGLLERSGLRLKSEIQKTLSKISYEPCLTLLIELGASSQIPDFGGLKLEGEPVGWIADNQKKGISNACTITLQGGPVFSRVHRETEAAEVIRMLLEPVTICLGSEPVAVQLHRWLYGRVETGYASRYVALSDEGLGRALLIAGDGFGMGGVEGAVQSGIDAAERLLNELD